VDKVEKPSLCSYNLRANCYSLNAKDIIPIAIKKSPDHVIDVSPKISPKKPTPQPNIKNTWNEDNPFPLFAIEYIHIYREERERVLNPAATTLSYSKC